MLATFGYIFPFTKIKRQGQGRKSIYGLIVRSQFIHSIVIVACQKLSLISSNKLFFLCINKILLTVIQINYSLYFTEQFKDVKLLKIT